jgi:hypothetical protein
MLVCPRLRAVMSLAGAVVALAMERAVPRIRDVRRNWRRSVESAEDCIWSHWQRIWETGLNGSAIREQPVSVHNTRGECRSPRLLEDDTEHAVAHPSRWD